MWKHVVMETTYWGHTLIEANKRKSTKGDVRFLQIHFHIHSYVSIGKAKNARNFLCLCNFYSCNKTLEIAKKVVLNENLFLFDFDRFN